jgi:hypothetical protein
MAKRKSIGKRASVVQPPGRGFRQEQDAFEPFPEAIAAGEALPLPSIVRRQATAAGLLGRDKSARVTGRVTPQLLDAARSASGLRSDTELLEYALSRVALEDDFGARLLARKGSVPKDIEL